MRGGGGGEGFNESDAAEGEEGGTECEEQRRDMNLRVREKWKRETEGERVGRRRKEKYAAEREIQG